MLEKIHSRRFVKHTISGKADIGNHPQYIGFKLLIQGQGLLVIAGHQDFRTRPHGHQTVLFVKGPFHHRLGLADQLPVKNGQQRREIIG